jgi:hypothetical protein
MVVVPAATPVATPPIVIVAYAVLDDCHENVVPASVLPSEFLAVAVNVCVAATLMLGEVGETVTVATVVLSTPGPVGESPPQAPSAVVRIVAATAAPR